MIEPQATGARQLDAEVVSDEELHRDVGLAAGQPVHVEDARHVRAPIPDMEVPGAGELRWTLDAIDAEIAGGGVAYVHCWAGRGRTGTVVGCWLVRHGLVGEDALARIVTLRRSLPDGRA